MDDFYNDLGVSKSATADEIKKAYREAAFKYHPDRNSGNPQAEEKFKKINAAYSVLSDASKRAEYDRYGSNTYRNNNAQQQSTYTQQQNTYYDPFEQFWKNAEQNYYNTQRHTEHQTYYYSPKQTRRKSWSQLFSSLMILLLALFFLSGAIFMGPIGFFIVLYMFYKGLTGTIKALLNILHVKRD